MGFYPIWRPSFVPPHPLASNVRKHHLPIRFRDLVILRLCFRNQLLTRDCDHDHGDHLSLELWKGSGAFPYVSPPPPFASLKGLTMSVIVRVEADLSSSGFPGSFFTNDPTYVRNGSPTSFDVSFLDAEKARKGSTEDDKGGLMHIRPYTPDSSKYPVHSLPFEISAGDLKTPVTTAFPPPGVTNAGIARAPNKDRENHSPTLMVDSGSRPVSYISLTKTDDPKSAVFTRDKKKSWIQPPPEAHIQVPHKETRSRKETPSLITQATCASTNSFSQAVITFAMKSPVLSATARTMVMNTIPEQRPGPAKDVCDTQQTTQSAASAIRETVDGTGQDVPSKANLPSQPDNCGRI